MLILASRMNGRSNVTGGTRLWYVRAHGSMPDPHALVIMTLLKLVAWVGHHLDGTVFGDCPSTEN